jgi:hypothetical protein
MRDSPSCKASKFIVVSGRGLSVVASDFSDPVDDFCDRFCSPDLTTSDSKWTRRTLGAGNVVRSDGFAPSKLADEVKDDDATHDNEGTDGEGVGTIELMDNLVGSDVECRRRGATVVADALTELEADAGT